MARRGDCSGHITAGGDTTFYAPTWSPVWCQCLQFSSRNNRSVDDMTLYRLPQGASPPLSQRHTYDVTQSVGDPDLAFEFYEAILHPGAKASARFAFNVPVSVYFAERYDVDGQDHDPDYQTHFVTRLTNVTSGVVEAPAINASGTWAFVWDKNFKLQKDTVGMVTYHFDMVEYALPAVGANNTREGEGRFCWDSGQYNHTWFISAHWTNNTVNVTSPLTAELQCVPRYALTVPIMCIPVVLAIIVEVLIIVFCICKRKHHDGKDYEQIN